jgi:multiple sugar transport system permease protein
VKVEGQPAPASLGSKGRSVTSGPRRQSIDERRWIIPLPGFVLLALATFPPFFYALYLSLFNYDNQAKVATEFVWLRNYATILTSGRSLHAFGETLIISFESTFLSIVFGFVIALLIQRYAPRLDTWLLILFLLPMIISPVVAALNFSLLLNTLYGPIDQVLYVFTHTVIAWTDTPFLATEVIVMNQVWQSTPFAILLFYSGLQSLPVEALEAARVDGAQGLKFLWFITLPLLRSIVIVTVLFEFLLASAQFTPTQLLTSGGPGNATESIALYIYRVGIAETGSISLAAAAGVIALVVTVIIATIWVKTTKSKDLYGIERGAVWGEAEA